MTKIDVQNLDAQKAQIGILILTKNEELHIARCIDSVGKISKNIFVIDSFSNDRTINILQEKNVCFIQNKFINYGSQLQLGIKKFPFRCDYLLRLDADEYLSNELIKSLMNINTKYEGFNLSRTIKYHGVLIDIPGYLPQPNLRLFKRSNFKIIRPKMDEKIIVNGEVACLDGLLIDENLKGRKAWITKHKKYASLEASTIIDNESGKSKVKNIYYNLPYFLRSFAFFFFYLILILINKNKNKIINIKFILVQILYYRLLVDVYIVKKRIIKLFKS
jgi:hypothetical protein